MTATVDDAQADLDFCLDALGLRLVKKTVNFDNHHVYHFYYGDEQGTPGTIWTTFPYANRGVRTGTKGAGQVTATSFSVPTGSLSEWRTWLAKQGIAVSDVAPRFGEPAIAFSDQSGLAFELVATDRDTRVPWVGDRRNGSSAVAGIADIADVGIRGLHSITCVVREPAKSIELLTGLLGFEVIAQEEGRIRLGIHRGGPGNVIDLVHDAAAPPAANGIGTVHHVAVAISTEEEQLTLREDLLRHGAKVTEVRDRCYFKSIYFREPGGVLVEVATIEPGFTADEEPSQLGRDLKLPPWEEPHRADIEAALVPVDTER